MSTVAGKLQYFFPFSVSVRVTVTERMAPSSLQAPLIVKLSLITASVTGVSMVMAGTSVSTAGPKPTSHEVVNIKIMRANINAENRDFNFSKLLIIPLSLYDASE